MKFSSTLSMAALAHLSSAVSFRGPASGIQRRTNHGEGEHKVVEEPKEVVVDEHKKVVVDEHANAWWEKLNPHGGAVNGGQVQVIIIWANPGGGAETTKINDKHTVTQTVTIGADATAHPPATHAAPAAASHTVKVGGPSGLVYEPEQLKEVPIGDTIIFEFYSMNHTATQSTFDAPCDPLGGGMDTGFIPNPNNTVSPPPQVAMQVMVDTPLWFYCKQGKHCSGGMVFSVNPTAEKSHEKFLETAKKQQQGGEEAAKPPAAEPPAAEPPAAAPTEVAKPAPPAEAETPGEGHVKDGACVCVVSCSAGSFPNSEVQGVGAWGGVPGALPMNLAAWK